MIHRVISVDKFRDPNIAVTLRSSDGKRRKKIVPYFRPYFYVPAEFDDEEEYIALDGVKVRKVTCSSDQYMREARKDYVKTYEHDVPYGQRWMIDKQVYGWVDDDLNPVDAPNEFPALKKIYWDIEVAEPTKHQALDVKRTGRIVSIAGFDGNEFHVFYFGKKKAHKRQVTLKGYTREWPMTIHVFPTEERMLEGFIQYVKTEDPDLLVGFNSEKYDWPMLVNRCNLLKVKLSPMSVSGWATDRDCPGRQLADLWVLYDWTRLTKERSTSLAAISKKHGITVDKSAQAGVYDLWTEGETEPAKAEELIIYNARDVELNWFIDQKEKLTDFALSMQEMTGVDSLSDTTKASVVADVLCLRESFMLGRPLPSRTDDEPEDYEGAQVLAPRANGVLKNVAVYDFSRLYPSLIVALNISPETRTGTKVTWADPEYNIYDFDRKETGLLAYVVQRAFGLRDYCEKQGAEAPTPEAKTQWDLRAQATKKIINGIYGALGYVKFRLYEKEVAETVTGAGRFLINSVDQLLIQKGENPIYGDTDSVFVQTDDVTRTTPNVFSCVAEACKVMGIAPLKIKHEKTYWSLLILKDAKKRYTGYIVYKDGEWLAEPKRETKGFEEKRSDSAEITAKVQAEVFDMILRFEPREKVLQHCIDAIRLIASGKLPATEVAPMPQLSEDPDQSQNQTFLPIVASRYSNKWFKMGIRAGDRVNVLYVKGVPKGLPSTNAIAVEPGTPPPHGVSVDWHLMAQKAIGEKMAKLFDALGWTHEAARCRNPHERLIVDY